MHNKNNLKPNVVFGALLIPFEPLLMKFFIYIIDENYFTSLHGVN